MSRYREQLTRAIRAASVESSSSYAWFGRRSRPLPAVVTAALEPGAVRDYLVDALGRELYRSFYSHGRPVPVSPDRFVPELPDRTFRDALSSANAGAGGWDPGWRIQALEGGTALVDRNGLCVRARVSDCRVVGGGWDAGSMVSLRRPKEVTGGFSGFFTALGDAMPARGRGEVEVRIYFNVTPAGAVPLVAVSTRLLNEANVPFSLKVVDRPAGFLRCDAAVLYLERNGFDRARGSLSAIASACARHLRGDAPAFAKPLGLGIAVGEHRRSLGGSFGSSRCRLVAEGIVTAHVSGADRLADRVDAVARRFADHGLDVDRPYLLPGSVDRYEL